MTYARGDHVHPTDETRASTAVATTTVNGLMSASDKVKLDGLQNVTYSLSGNTLTITQN